jgi:hypothetical protein
MALGKGKDTSSNRGNPRGVRFDLPILVLLLTLQAVAELGTEKIGLASSILCRPVVVAIAGNEETEGLEHVE